MSIDTNKLNETEIICPSELSLDEKYIYNDSGENSKNDNKYSSSNKSNILLNVLKDFSVRYDLDDRKIMKSKKFLLSFEDLISLVKFALEFQIKINNSLNVKDYLNEISQDFINNLSYYVFSYEKTDISTNSNVNINYNTYNNNLNNKKNKKQNVVQTPMNYQSNSTKRKSVEDFSPFNSNKNSCVENKNTYYRANYNQKKITKNINNENIKDKNKEEKNNKNKLNKSVERRSNVYMSDFKNKNNIEENKKGKLNKSTEKRKKGNNNINEDKNGRKSLSIITACENLKNAKSRRLSHIDENNNKINLNYYSSNTRIYDNIGVRKQIISNNIIRPSTMANKLLQKGIKYITDFKDLKEEESRKRY